MGQGFYWLGDPASNFLRTVTPAHSRNGGGFWEKSRTSSPWSRTGEAVAEGSSWVVSEVFYCMIVLIRPPCCHPPTPPRKGPTSRRLYTPHTTSTTTTCHSRKNCQGRIPSTVIASSPQLSSLLSSSGMPRIIINDHSPQVRVASVSGPGPPAPARHAPARPCDAPACLPHAWPPVSSHVFSRMSLPVSATRSPPPPSLLASAMRCATPRPRDSSTLAATLCVALCATIGSAYRLG